MRYIFFNPNMEKDLCVQQNSGELCTEYMTMMNHVPHHSPSKKVKRYRSAFTTDQVNYLEQQFKKFPYIGNAHRKEVAMALNIPERAIKIWFQNRRMKEKKETGIKEFDEDRSNRNSMEFAKDQLNNVNAPSANDQRQYSLPLLTDIKKPVAIKHVVTNKPYNINVLPHTEPMEEQHYRVSNNPNIRASLVKIPAPSHYQGSAQFSLNLGKTYKSKPTNELDCTAPVMRHGEEQNTDLKPINGVGTHEQMLPEDLSSNRKTNMSAHIQTAHTVQGTPRNTPNPGYFSVIPTVSPLYAQPYIGPGGVLWRPISVMPIVSPGSTVPASSLGIAPSSLSVPKMNCNCDCHINSTGPVALQQNTQNPQYIQFTALPYHNSSAKL